MRMYLCVSLFLGTSTAFSAQEIFMGLLVEPERADDSYSRDLYGGWIDEGRNGKNTRAEVLEDEMLSVGLWWGRYTGRVYSNSSSLDIDHLVPSTGRHG